MKLPAILGVILLAAFSACGRKDDPPNGTTPPSPTVPRDRTSTGTQDQELAQRVRRVIMDDATMSASTQNLEVTATGGTVTLRGTVKTQSEKDSIGAKVKSLAGVTSVINDLTVSG